MTQFSAFEDITRVLFVAAEADPLIKVGGLGDVAGSLPNALRALPPEKSKTDRLDVRLVIPFHSGIDRSIRTFRKIAAFPIPHEPTPLTAEVYTTEIDGLPVYLIAGDPIPSTGPVYALDADLDTYKYTFFSLATLELARFLQWKPHILHANDWHTALAVYVLNLIRPEDQFFSDTYSVLTLHNLPFMGSLLDKMLPAFGLPPAMEGCLPDWAKRLPLPLGLQAADQIVAVSPHYAEEILTPAFGCGLEEFLLGRQDALSGILNGIDIESWNPACDAAINTPFDLAHLDLRIRNKTALLGDLGLSTDPSIPLLGLISRMDPQKGVDLVPDGLRLTADLPWQAVILGTGIPELEKSLGNLEAEYPHRIRVITRFDSRLARQIYAGADLLLMPSRYEPCGLAQMIAMGYGCIPFARDTGGLHDTIIDQPNGNSNTGFLFSETTPIAFEQGLRRALAHYSDPKNWQRMQKNGMQKNFSWEQSAIDYAQLYSKLRN